MSDFPTRDGKATGHANERQMLDAVQGVETIRTKIRTNADGSTTRLKTRGGHPEFVTTTPEEPDEEYLPYCAAIPVDVAAICGFKYDKTQPTPFIPQSTESVQASAELEIKHNKIKYDYNKRWVRNVSAKKDRLHPGNRNWFDGRTDGRQTRHVVSWWCPYLTAKQLAYTWVDTPPWLGDSGVTKQKSIRNETGSPLTGTWQNTKGFVFVDGVRKCDFNKHVWAAAFDTTNQRIVALVTNSVSLSTNGWGSIETSAFLLMAFDLVTKEYSTIADLGGGWYTESRIPLPVFRHDAAEVLAVLNIPVDYDSTIYRVSVADGNKTLFRPIAEDSYPDGGWLIDYVVAMRYDETSAIKLTRELSFNRGAGLDQQSYVEIIIEDVSIGRTDYIHNASVSSYFGTLACVISADGQGGYLIARLPDYQDITTYVVSGGSPTPVQTALTPGPGPNYTRYSDSDPSTFDWQVHNAAVDVPVYFARAGQAPEDWVPLGMTHPWCRPFTSGSYFVPPLFGMTLVDQYAPDGIQLEMQFFLATSPNGKFTLVGGRMPARIIREYNGDAITPNYTWSNYTQQCKALVIRNKVAVGEPNRVNSLTAEWPGEMATINSPIFYARPYVLKKDK